jgi:hypothetical protein
MFLPPPDPDLPTGSSTQEIYDWEFLTLEAARGVRLYALLFVLSAIPAALAANEIALGIFLYLALSTASMMVLRVVCRVGLRKAVERARLGEPRMGS